ncbi:hypothetical protein K440DRAFT_640620 [Wilcoxina mikolae CBS 423.85]|nr:hypothetical protein K440DRAFT_640620 [Wilcoxina mikolae CBS 423.85]
MEIAQGKEYDHMHYHLRIDPGGWHSGTLVQPIASPSVALKLSGIPAIAPHPPLRCHQHHGTLYIHHWPDMLYCVLILLQYWLQAVLFSFRDTSSYLVSRSILSHGSPMINDTEVTDSVVGRGDIRMLFFKEISQSLRLSFQRIYGDEDMTLRWQ